MGPRATWALMSRELASVVGDAWPEVRRILDLRRDAIEAEARLALKRRIRDAMREATE